MTNSLVEMDSKEIKKGTLVTFFFFWKVKHIVSLFSMSLFPILPEKRKITRYVSSPVLTQCLQMLALAATFGLSNVYLFTSFHEIILFRFPMPPWNTACSTEERIMTHGWGIQNGQIKLYRICNLIWLYSLVLGLLPHPTHVLLQEAQKMDNVGHQSLPSVQLPTSRNSSQGVHKQAMLSNFFQCLSRNVTERAI